MTWYDEIYCFSKTQKHKCNSKRNFFLIVVSFYLIIKLASVTSYESDMFV